MVYLKLSLLKTPIFNSKFFKIEKNKGHLFFARAVGFEPTAYGFGDRHSTS